MHGPKNKMHGPKKQNARSKKQNKFNALLTDSRASLTAQMSVIQLPLNESRQRTQRQSAGSKMVKK